MTQSEMMDYGTGEWYFGQAEDQSEYQLQERVKLGTLRRNPYLHYDESSVTLWDILPQHYYSNYLVAVVILLYGWLPGILLLTVMAAFYAYFFLCPQNPRRPGVKRIVLLRPLPAVPEPPLCSGKLRLSVCCVHQSSAGIRGKAEHHGKHAPAGIYFFRLPV